ncbi:MAG: Cna B-type domain-containing protein [Eubacteriales bacterium]|nr:Cna B-type domain-containing protein [Eubacteriales bacterium]
MKFKRQIFAIILIFAFILNGLFLLADDPAGDPGSPAVRGSENAIYLNGQAGNDDENGLTPEEAVKTFAKAKELAKNNSDITQIIVTGTANLEGDISLKDLNVKILRYKDFNDYLFCIPEGKKAQLSDIKIDGNSENNPNIVKSLVIVNKGATLNITEGTVLRNNKIKIIKNTRTFGGAVFAKSSTINMTGGIIEHNSAINGGGICLHRSTLNFSGGKVNNNKADRVTDESVTPYQHYLAGGGILANKGSTVKMSGAAEVSNNFSHEVGGGISLGSRIWEYGDNYLYMEGGLIQGNTAGATGGGIMIQARYFNGGSSKAYISGGKILNNKTDRSGYTDNAFGGAGIYVNGATKEWGGNGELYLKNALITDNSAKFEGAGYAACPISKTEVYLTEGAAIYGNKTSEEARDIYIYSDLNYGLHSGEPPFKISEYMLGGQSYNWKFAEKSFESLEGTLPNEKFLGLYTNETGNKLTEQLTKVIISGNESATRGGGIGSNGTVIIGKDEEPIEISVTKVWEDSDNKDGQRPAEVEVKLSANGSDTGLSLKLNEKNGWTGKFEGLPKTADGVEIVYTIGEAEVSGYTVAITGDVVNGFIVTNKKTPSETPTTTTTVPTTTTTDPTTTTTVPTSTVTLPHPTPSYSFTVPTETVKAPVPTVHTEVTTPQIPATGESSKSYVLGISTLGLLMAVILLRRKVH